MDSLHVQFPNIKQMKLDTRSKRVVALVPNAAIWLSSFGGVEAMALGMQTVDEKLDLVVKRLHSLGAPKADVLLKQSMTVQNRLCLRICAVVLSSHHQTHPHTF